MHAERPKRPSFVTGPMLRFAISEDPEKVEVVVEVTNSGAEKATSVEAVIALPAGVTCISGDAEIRADGLYVNYGTLDPGASAEKSFVVDVSSYRDDSLVIDDIRLVCAELGTLSYGPFTSDLAPSPHLELTVDCPTAVGVSEVIRVRTTITNSGRSAAENVTVHFAARGSMIVLPGPVTLECSGDQAAALSSKQEKSAGDSIVMVLGSIPNESSITITAYYRITVPVTNDTGGIVVSVFDGSEKRASFERDLRINADAVFHPAHNVLRRVGPSTASVGSTVQFTAKLTNDGAVAAHRLRVRLAPDSSIDRLDVEASPAVNVSESFDAASRLLSSVLLFDQVAASESISLSILVHISDSASNNDVAGIRLFLTHDDRPETELTAAAVKIRAIPRFYPETSLIRIETGERIRAYGSAGAKVVIANQGDAPARGVVVTLSLPHGLNIGDVVGARAIGPDAFAFEEVPAHNVREAAFRITLATPRYGSEDLEIKATLEAEGVPAFSMAPGMLGTFAQPVFSESSVVVARVLDEELYSVRASIRNSGDASASKLTLKVEDLADGEYAYGTTYVNAKRQYDTAKHRAQLLDAGIRFDDFEPGTTQTVSFAVVPSGNAAPSVRLRCHWGPSESDSIVLDARRVIKPVPDSDDASPLAVDAVTDDAVSLPIAEATHDTGASVRLELITTGAWASRALKLAQAVRSPGGRVLVLLAFFFPNRIMTEQDDPTAAHAALGAVGDALKEAIAAAIARRMMTNHAVDDSDTDIEPFSVEAVLGDGSLVARFDKMLEELTRTAGADANVLAASIPQLYDPSDKMRYNHPRLALVVPQNVVSISAEPYGEKTPVSQLSSLARFLPDNVPGFSDLESALRGFARAIIDLPKTSNNVSLEETFARLSVETGALLEQLQNLTVPRTRSVANGTTTTGAASADGG